MHGLRTDTGWAGCEIVGRDFVDEPPEVADEDTPRQLTVNFGGACAPIFPREVPEAGVRQRLPELGRPNVSHTVALACEREDRVRACEHTPVDLLREMHAEEREGGIRDGIDQTIHEPGRMPSQYVITP